MKPWQIIVAIAIVLFGVYVAAVIVFAYQMKQFDKRMERNLAAIDVLIVQKYDMLRLIGKMFVKFEIPVPTEFMLHVRPKFEETLLDIGSAERAVIKSFLMRTAQSLFYYGEINQALAQHPEYIAIKENYAEIDRQYRHSVVLYNADVLGYNYWSHLFWFRWVAKVRKMIDKEIIS